MVRSKGAVCGTVVGFVSWVVVLAGISLGCGAFDDLADVLYLTLLICLALAGMTLVVAYALDRHFGPGHPTFRIGFWGMLLFDIGLMILLCNVWIAPRMEEHPDLIATLLSLSSVYKTSNVVPMLLITAGTALLLFAASRFIGNEADPTPSPLRTPEDSGSTPPGTS